MVEEGNSSKQPSQSKKPNQEKRKNFKSQTRTVRRKTRVVTTIVAGEATLRTTVF